METVSCNICGSTVARWRALYSDHCDRGISYQLMQCRDCQLVYLNPRPGHEDVLACSPVYQNLLRDMRWKLERTPLGRLGIRMMRRARTPERCSQSGSLLDIGCASGEYLAYLRGLGWDVSGIEMDPEAAAHARCVLGLSVATGAAETALSELPSGQFDVVTMWHVLEHLDDPRKVLVEVRRVLKPGGRLLLEVPNFNSVWRSLLRGNWFPIEYPYHRYHFTPRTLRELLISTGFDVQGIQGQPAPAETIWSFHMVWNRLTKETWNGRLLWIPAAVVALYPLEMLLAALGRTNHMKTTARPAILG